MIWYILSAVVVLFFAKVNYENSSVKKTDKVASIKCTGKGLKEFLYEDIKDCRSAYEEFGPNGKCENGCVNLYSCLRACPAGAIRKDLSIDLKVCDGCGVCVDICPLNLITLTDRKERLYVKCSTELKSEDAENFCVQSCIKCYLCVDVCSRSAISIDEKGIPEIDFKRCNLCMDCLKKCSTDIIIKNYD